MNTHTGIVKWYQPALGYGFIAAAPSLKLELGLEPEADLYVHAQGIEGKLPKDLRPDDRVQFEVEKTHKGWRAIHVRIISQAQPLEHVRD